MRGVADTQLGGEPVLVDQAAEQITPADTIKIDDVGHCFLVAQRRLATWRSLPEGAVRPGLVVVERVRLDDEFEVAAAEDQESVKALAAHRANPTFGVRAPAVRGRAP